jgi:hypothetical protein
MLQRRNQGVTVLCDTTAIEECFKKHTFNREQHCAKEIADFKAACSEKSKYDGTNPWITNTNREMKDRGSNAKCDSCEDTIKN